jgi:5-methylcytosine-specific restriction endonuclease McrA
MEDFGYSSDELTRGMTKKVWVICDSCGSERLIRYNSYVKTNGRCNSCATIGTNNPNYGNAHSDETRHLMSESHRGAKNHFHGKHHSKKTKLKISKSNSGINHPKWNPNLTDKERCITRNTLENREWSLNVKMRDNFTCQKCGDNKGGNLISHHISGYSAHLNSRYDLDNGITLCEDCHKQFHRLYGYKYFTGEDFFVWVNNHA